MKYRSKAFVGGLAFALGLCSSNSLLRRHTRNDRRQQGTDIMERALGEQHGRQQALDEVRVFAHGQLQAHIVALQHCLTSAEADLPSERNGWIGKARAQAQLLHDDVLRLHCATSETLLPTNLEQAVREVTANLSVAYPACTCHLEVFSHPSAELATQGRQALVLVLYNALQNAYQHAHPSSVLVQLQYAPDATILVVADDGCSLPFRQVEVRGRGLRDMQRLVEQCGGTFSIESLPKSGTRVTATFPYTSPEQYDKGA